MVWDNIPFNFERDFERRMMKHRALRAADRFLVHTERSRRMLAIEGADERRIQHVDPGVDTDLFSPGKADRASFGLNAEDFVILFVGWLLPRKGIEFSRCTSSCAIPPSQNGGSGCSSWGRAPAGIASRR
jgi:glycosyltransferase involved in cell wall biosynthesis